MQVSNERWLVDGDCRMCRRRPYCTNACKKFKENRDKAIQEMVQDQAFSKAIEEGWVKNNDQTG